MDQTVNTRQDADECTKLGQRNDRSVEGAADGVVVKLLDVDFDKKRISLSMKALLNDDAE